MYGQMMVKFCSKQTTAPQYIMDKWNKRQALSYGRKQSEQSCWVYCNFLLRSIG